MTTHLIDEELELDDSSPALMLTVALHTRTAEPKSWLSQRKVRRVANKGDAGMRVEWILNTQKKRLSLKCDFSWKESVKNNKPGKPQMYQ